MASPVAARLSAVDHWSLVCRFGHAPIFATSASSSDRFSVVWLRVRLTSMAKPLSCDNYLAVNTIVHHHGAHVAGSSDGSALFNDDDIAATPWYHYDINFTANNAFLGLAGTFLLRDHVEAVLLPGMPVIRRCRANCM